MYRRGPFQLQIALLMPKITSLAALPDGDFRVMPEDVVILIDETGHEDLGLASHPVFGFGGIAVSGRRAGMLDRGWKQLKGEYFGDPEITLHASTLHPNSRQIEAFRSFFRRRFLRFAVLLKQPILHPEGADFIRLVVDVLKQELGQILANSRFPIPGKIVLLFEASERLSPKMVESTPAYKSNWTIHLSPLRPGLSRKGQTRALWKLQTL
jgi:hypothetical protein